MRATQSVSSFIYTESVIRTIKLIVKTEIVTYKTKINNKIDCSNWNDKKNYIHLIDGSYKHLFKSVLFQDVLKHHDSS